MSEAHPGKGRGCFFYGCLTVTVLAVVLAVGLYFAVRTGLHYVRDHYTAPAPMAVPRVESTAEEIQGVKQRFQTFTDALKAGTLSDALSLSERDLNLLIRHGQDTAPFKDAIHIEIVSNKLKSTLSLPLDTLGFRPLGWDVFRGRYLNGVAEIKASLAQGVFIVTLDSLEVNGTRVPEPAMANLRSQNLAKDLYKDAQSLELLRRLESIEVRDGQVLVKPAPVAAEAPASP